MLTTILHMQMGTPYIYQGEEIGMTNVYFDNIDDYRDIELLNMYKERIDAGYDKKDIMKSIYEKGREEIGMTNVYFDNIDDYRDIELLNMYKERIDAGYDKKDIMKSIYEKGRDNARTPMQWDDSINGGFSKATPWIATNQNYKEINVKNNIEDENSIFNHYKKLIQIRKENEVVLYGDFELLYKDNNSIFAYIRELNNEKILVVSNFYGENEKFILNKELKYKNCEILLSNYKDSSNNIEKINLRPYESIIYKLS